MWRTTRQVTFTQTKTSKKGGLLVLFGFGQMDLHLWPPAARLQQLLRDKLQIKMVEERVPAFYVLGSSGVMEENSSLLILCWGIKAGVFIIVDVTFWPRRHFITILFVLFMTLSWFLIKKLWCSLFCSATGTLKQVGSLFPFACRIFSFTGSQPACLWTFSPYWDFSCVVSACPALLCVLYLCAPTRPSHSVASLSLLLSQFPLLPFFFFCLPGVSSVDYINRLEQIRASKGT